MADLKWMYLSAHDTTVAAIMLGIEQQQVEAPPFACVLFYELWQKDKTDGKSNSDFYLKFFYNDLLVNPGNKVCTDGNQICPYPEVKTYLQSREFKGDWNKACTEGDFSEGMEWWVWLMIGIGGVIVLGIILFIVIIKCFKKSARQKKVYNNVNQSEVETLA